MHADPQLDFARRVLLELEHAAEPIPLDEEAQYDLREALSEEAYQFGRPQAAEDATLQGLTESLARAVGIELPPNGRARFDYYEAGQSALLEHTQRQLERLSGATVATINPAFAGIDKNVGIEEAGVTLSQAVEMYIGAPERSANGDSSRKMDRSRLGALRDILGGDRTASSITKADMRNYLSVLMKLPANYTKRFPGMSPSDAVQAGEAVNAKRLSPTSIKRDIQAVRSFFSWLTKQDIIPSNPAEHVEGPRAPKKSNRRPYSTAEMQKLLDATRSKNWTYWLTRIAMYQGFRFTEPLGLKVGDLERRGDIWVVKLRSNEYRGLKTEETARDVPLHPKLIELGLLALAEGRKPDELLIRDVPIGAGKAFNAAQKRMGRIVRNSVSGDPNLTFHSLRHNFRDAMREAGLPRGVEERLGGWTSNGAQAMEGYGQGHRIETLANWLAQVDYPGVDPTN